MFQKFLRNLRSYTTVENFQKQVENAETARRCSRTPIGHVLIKATVSGVYTGFLHDMIDVQFGNLYRHKSWAKMCP